MARRVPLCNAAFKLAGVMLMLPLIDQLVSFMQWLDPSSSRQAVNFHTLFNITISCIFLPLITPVARFVENMLPQEKSSEDKAEPIYLDYENIGNPAVALASATLETIRMGRVIEDMLQESLTAIETRDTKLSQIVISRDDEVDNCMRRSSSM